MFLTAVGANNFSRKSSLGSGTTKIRLISLLDVYRGGEKASHGSLSARVTKSSVTVRQSLPLDDVVFIHTEVEISRVYSFPPTPSLAWILKIDPGSPKRNNIGSHRSI